MRRRCSRSVSFSRRGCRTRGRFDRYSKLETAKCRPVEDLSALNQTSGQERKQGAASTARSNPRRTTTQRHTILLLKAPAPLKRESFIFERYTCHRERKQSRPYANSPILSSSLSSMMGLANSEPQVLQTGE